MREGESSSVRRRIQPFWKLPVTVLAVPWAVGQERVRVRVVLLEIRFLSGACLRTTPEWHTPCPNLTMALVELRNVSKIYHLGGEEIRALDDLSLDIQEGEFISIIGPSGSGKSTLMHILGCLDSPTSGTIKLDGTLIHDASPRELARIRNRKIGFVFQFFNLLPKLNVLQNVELPMIYSGLPARKRRERALEALKMVEMENRARHRPMQLSGGQQQRAAIARALVNNPKIVFADEPTGNLDSHTGEVILELFRALSQRGRTIALVTHDPEIAAVTPRRIEIRDGKISKQLDPKLAGLDRVNAEQGARNAEPSAGTQRPAA